MYSTLQHVGEDGVWREGGKEERDEEGDRLGPRQTGNWDLDCDLE